MSLPTPWEVFIKDNDPRDYPAVNVYGMWLEQQHKEMLDALCGIHDELINLARLQDWHSDIFKNKFYKVQSAIEDATGLPIYEAIKIWEEK